MTASLFSMLALLSLLLLASVGVDAIEFDLVPYQRRCFRRDITAQDLLLGTFSFDPPTGMVSVSVQDEVSRQMWQRSSFTDGTGKFALTPETTGEKKVCFENNAEHSPVQRQVTFELKTGVDAKDYSKMAKVSHIKPVEADLQRVQAEVEELTRDFNALSEQQKTLGAANDATHTKFMYVSVLSMVMLATLSYTQVVYLRKFFQEKKMID